MRNERKILRFDPQKLRKSFANGNPTPVNLEKALKNRRIKAQEKNNKKAGKWSYLTSRIF